MHIRGRSFVFFFVIVHVFTLPAASLADEDYIQTDTPILMRLMYKKNDEAKEAKIPAIIGNAISPAKGLPQLVWQIKPGDSLTAGKRPQDRLVSLYTGTDIKKRLLLSLVHIRYFQNKDGNWAPFYKINQQYLAVRRGGRWVPVTSVRGVPILIVITDSGVPNAYGFYPKLNIGFNTRRMQIDSWFVR